MLLSDSSFRNAPVVSTNAAIASSLQQNPEYYSIPREPYMTIPRNRMNILLKHENFICYKRYPKESYLCPQTAVPYFEHITALRLVITSTCFAIIFY